MFECPYREVSVYTRAVGREIQFLNDWTDMGGSLVDVNDQLSVCRKKPNQINKI
jgi:hypothetical protein